MQDAWRMFEQRGDAGPTTYIWIICMHEHHHLAGFFFFSFFFFFYSWLYIISYNPCDEVTQVASFSTNCLAHRGFTQVVIYSYSHGTILLDYVPAIVLF
jgi:hypothetical protein